jgi:hypothetical protein
LKDKRESRVYKEPRVFRGSKGRLVSKVKRVFRVIPGRSEIQAFKELRGKLVSKVSRELLVIQGFKGRLVFRAKLELKVFKELLESKA